MADAPYKLILLRHGESEWNAKNLFTGWVDVNLTEKGEKEAVRGGELLKDAGLLPPDVLHTSLQKRAIRTAQFALEPRTATGSPRPPLLAAERAPLRRPPGQGQGPDARRVRRGAVHALAPLVRHPPPPPLEDGTEFSQSDDARYATIPPELRPRTECLKDVVTRMLPYWYDSIVPDLLTGRTVLVAAHGNSLRALVKHLDGISDADIAGLNIPTGIPLTYELDADFRPPEPGRHVPRRGRRPGGHRGREEPGQEVTPAPPRRPPDLHRQAGGLLAR